MKKNVPALIAIFLLFLAPAFSKQAAYNGDNYDIDVRYNDTACPGDAVFVRIRFTQAAKKNKVSKTEFSATTAKLLFFVDGKQVRSADFFHVPGDPKCHELLAAVPLSTWWKSESDCSIKIVYSLYGQNTFEFPLPFRLEPKEFVNETISLNDSNTAIKTDTSAKRMEQIARLNAILEKANPSSFYAQSEFSAPTEATRRTSFFADRRVYAYTNGKSSTSLHYGIDYGIPTGSSVTSCAAGKVVLAEDRVSTGWSVVIEHLPGLYSLYYHMSELKVKEGDMVNKGELIGLSGATGLATGPHLHWEMRLNMEAVNPDFFLTDFSFAK